MSRVEPMKSASIEEGPLRFSKPPALSSWESLDRHVLSNLGFLLNGTSTGPDLKVAMADQVPALLAATSAQRLGVAPTYHAT